MLTPLKVVSFFTAGAYAEEAAELVRSATNLTVPIFTEERGPFASWHEAVCFKPQYILEKLEELHAPYEMILWTDADSRFRQEPDWSILKDADFAACHFQWSPSHVLETLTGTLAFRRTPVVLEFVRLWVELTPEWATANKDVPEQLSLNEAYHAFKDRLRFVELPRSWLSIQPEFGTMFPDEPCVIAHLQASRKNRR